MISVVGLNHLNEIATENLSSHQLFGKMARCSGEAVKISILRHAGSCLSVVRGSLLLACWWRTGVPHFLLDLLVCRLTCECLFFVDFVIRIWQSMVIRYRLEPFLSQDKRDILYSIEQQREASAQYSTVDTR